MKIKGLLSVATATAALLFSTTPVKADQVQIRCLAENMYHEARGESRQGQIAVSNVVMNRVESGRYPSTPCEVIRQRHRNTCQFSWVCAGRTVNNISLYNRMYNIAEDVYNNRVEDITNGALFFHSVRVNPSWSRTYIRTIRIGSHVFYRRR